MPGSRYLLFAALVAVAGVIGFEATRFAQQPSNARQSPSPPPERQKPHVPIASTPHEVSFDSLLADLQSTHENQRTAALDFLSRAHYSKREFLWDLMQQATDPVVKADIGKKLFDIYELLSTNPPPISLHVHEASLHDVMDALNIEMGTHMRWNSARDDGGPYTLDVDNMPFWEVIAALDKQRPFQIIPFNEVTFNTTKEGMSLHQISGPFFMYVRTADIKPVTSPPSFFVHYTIIGDPRLPLAELTFGESAHDDLHAAVISPDSAGNSLRHNTGGTPRSGATYGLIAHMQTYWPEKPGATIKSLQIKLSAVTFVPSPIVSVDAIDEKPGWESDLGDLHISVPTFTETINRPPFAELKFQCKVTPPDRADSVIFQLFEKDNRLRWAQRGDKTTGTASQSETYPSGKPYHLQATLLRKTFNLSADLEINDIPMPAR